jgi:hypothetical protein
VAKSEQADPLTRVASAAPTPTPHNAVGHRTRKMFHGTFSGTSSAGTAPRKSKHRTWEPIQHSDCCEAVASAKV